jgi:hypothetical protein
MTARAETPAPAAAGATRQEEVERPAPKADLPITPMMRVEHPFEREPKEISAMPGEREFEAMMKMAGMLAESGFLPRKLNTAGKVLAVILSGRELGLPPMLALRSIRIQEETGYPIIAADVLLGAFKRMGGKAKFTALSDKIATLWLKHPNGDEHTESFTIAMAEAAQLLGKENWKKYKQAMLRSRVITAALKSIGWEPAAGVYNPDEAEEIEFEHGIQSGATATVTSDGSVETREPEPAIKIRGVPLDQKKPDSTDYAIGLSGLTANIDWGGEKLGEATGDLAAEAKWSRFIRAIKVEIARRYVEEINRTEGDESAEGAVDQHYREKLGVERYDAIIGQIDEDGTLAPESVKDDMKP